MTHIHIEGWRGVNHSFALVNQCQILEWLAMPDVTLSHRDLPFAMGHWNGKTHDPGFSAADAERIAALPQALPGQPVDFVYRICSPFRTGADCPVADPDGHSPPTLTFMVTEMGLSSQSFEPGAERSDIFTRGANAIVTPSNWSRERLLEWGYAPEKVHVVPHGVNAKTFYPLTADERAANRRNLGLTDDMFVFLNLGAAFWNKGLDVLLLAYAHVRQSQPRARLIIKDQRNLYGVGLDDLLARLCSNHPALFTTDVLGSIQVITANLNQAQLRTLYGLADCYVSPYRAEGFNLPVLESLACGIPVIVTDGGATDDFCPLAFGIRVASRLESRSDLQQVARYREPILDAVVEALKSMLSERRDHWNIGFEKYRRGLGDYFNWAIPAERLRNLLQTCRHKEIGKSSLVGTV